MTMTYQPPQPSEIDVTDHQALIDLAKYAGLAPGNTILLDTSGAFTEFVGCSADQAATVFVDYKAALVARGYQWAMISCVAIDAAHSAFAVRTSAS